MRNEIMLIPSKPDDPKFNIVVEMKFKVFSIAAPLNIFQQAVLDREIGPKVDAAGKVFAEKLRDYCFDLMRTHHL